MVVKEAIRIAKDYVAETYRDEDIVEVGLEEVRFLEEDTGVWEVTIGFRHGWQTTTTPTPPPQELVGLVPPRPSVHGRTYKTVRIRDDGTVACILDRDASIPA